MGRYTGPKIRLEKREGINLSLKGKRGMSEKHPLVSGNTNIPGVHAKKPRKRLSDYGVHLREKQKAKRLYGLMERQFRNYFKSAVKKKGNTGLELLILLERRLDNVIYRLGFASTRAQARQFVSHGHVLINGKKCSFPSYEVSAGDKIELKKAIIEGGLVKENLEMNSNSASTSWLTRTEGNYGVVDRLPSREDIDSFINEALIVEFYSK